MGGIAPYHEKRAIERWDDCGKFLFEVAVIQIRNTKEMRGEGQDGSPREYVVSNVSESWNALRLLPSVSLSLSRVFESHSRP